MTMTAEAPTRRGTSNTNARGNTEDRRRRREYLVTTYQADITGIRVTYVDTPMPHLATALIGVTELYYPSPQNFVTVWNNFCSVKRVHGYIASIVEVAVCRCYRCGRILTVDTVTVDRIVPGCQGGTYRRSNIRPACGDCNSETGGALAGKGRR